VSDDRPPRIDFDRAKRGPTAADLEAMPATTAADWADATVILPVDRDIFEEAAAKQRARVVENRAKDQGGSAKEAARVLDSRSKGGEPARERGDTRVDTLRQTYGSDFAPGVRGDTKLSTLLARSGARSLSDYLGRSDSSRTGDVRRKGRR
jgi:hypothetical protein